MTDRNDEEDRIVGTTLGNVTKQDLIKGDKPPRVKAVLFVPEGEDAIESDLDIQVVSVDKAGLNMIAMRRC